MTSIPLLLTAPHPCSYLDDQHAQSAFVNPAFTMTNTLYSELINHGFRRSGNQVYRPQCADCQQCIPTRLTVADFQPNRQQKRCQKKNSQTRSVIKPATFDASHYAMYLRYQQQRHADGTMVNSSDEDYIQFLSSRWCNTQFIEFFIGDQLAALAIVDCVTDGLSAVYTFFEPQFSQHSLGVYAVLWQIAEAKKRNLPYVYLGFWIQECKKMAYKIHYQPLQGFIHGKWQPITATTF